MPGNWLQSLRHLDTMLEEAEIAFADGRQREHAQVLEGAQETFHREGGPWREALRQCWVGFLRSIAGGHQGRALASCEIAIDIAEVHELEELRAFADCCKAQIHLIAGDLLAGRLAGIRALAAFEARGNIQWACRTLWHLSSIMNAMEAWEESLGYCYRALAYARSGTNTRLLLVALWRIGSTLILSSHPGAGLRWCDAALALAPLPLDHAMITAVQGNGLVKIGKIEEGVRQLEEAVAWFAASSLTHMRLLFSMHLGNAYAQQGRELNARDVFADIATTSSKNGYSRLAQSAQSALDTLKGA